MHTGKKLAFAIILVFPLLPLGAGDSHLDQWSNSDPTYVPFPVSSIDLSADNRFVALRVEDPSLASEGRTVYLLDLKDGYYRRLGSHDRALSPSPSGHLFLYYRILGNPKEYVVLFSGLQPVRNFDIGEHQHAWWKPHSQIVMFEAGWPRDREGFNILGFLDTSTGGVSHIALRHVTELLTFCAKTGTFYTQYWYPDSSYSEAGTDEYDAKGKFLRSSRSPLAVYSANCRYVLPFTALSPHGPDDWGVFDARSRTRLMYFPWNDSGKADLHWFDSWNPRYDHLLLMHTTRAESKATTIDILDVRKHQVVKSWNDPTGAAPRVWSGDGKSTVTVRDHRIFFEPIPRDILMGSFSTDLGR